MVTTAAASCAMRLNKARRLSPSGKAESVAYATVVGFFGHMVGETNSDVQALIANADVFVGPGILVPTRNAGLFRWCLENGLRVVQPMTLMTVGFYNEPAGA